MRQEYSGRYFDDLTVGETLTTPPRVVSKEDVYAFAELTGDNNPLHVDEDFGRRTIFGKQIAHGMLTASITTGLVTGLGIFHGTVIAFLEVHAKFLAPVFFGEALTAECCVEEKQEGAKPNRGNAIFFCKVVNQNNAIVAETRWTLMLNRRPKSHV